MPNASAEDGKVALGAQGGESRLREVMRPGGFTYVRRAAKAPFRIALEARS